MKRALGGIVALTLASQVLSAANALLLHVLGLVVADTYAIASQVGLAGLTGVVVGILYNIAIGRPSFLAWRAWTIVAIIGSMGAAAGQLVLLSATGYFADHDALFVTTVVLGYGVGGAVISVAGVIGVRRACLGRPEVFAGVTILPNAGALGGTALAWIAQAWGADLSLVPMVGWVLGALAGLTMAARSGPLPTPDQPHTVESVTQMRTHVAGLSVGVIASTVMPLVYVTALAQLPAGAVYFATLVLRILNAAIALGVNSVLLVLYNWVSLAERNTLIPRLFSLAYPILTIVAIVGHFAFGEVDVVWSGVALIGWAAALVGSSITVREMNAQRKGRAILGKSILEAILTGAAAIALIANPSIMGYFAAFAVAHALTILAGGVSLRDWQLATIGAFSLAAASALIAFGW